MDELMEDSGELIFTAIEIDLDYEFDAARYFDFTKISEETFHSDIWFESAGSYSPSPFVTKLILREDNLLQQMDIPPRSNGDENMSLEGNQSNEPEIKDCRVMKGEILNNLKGVKLQHLPTSNIIDSWIFL
ncbi:protein TPX2-like [Impatiens glandulifera]|uniref:protein TPX2-like n=1 Tax=Impatiens glandulifera TaxID=253017 RepID=UPI001FB0FD8D|nr:protein TPX2-like [Impatiens glandulifera]